MLCCCVWLCKMEDIDEYGSAGVSSSKIEMASRYENVHSMIYAESIRFFPSKYQCAENEPNEVLKTEWNINPSFGLLGFFLSIHAAPASDAVNLKSPEKLAHEAGEHVLKEHAIPVSRLAKLLSQLWHGRLAVSSRKIQLACMRFRDQTIQPSPSKTKLEISTVMIQRQKST